MSSAGMTSKTEPKELAEVHSQVNTSEPTKRPGMASFDSSPNARSKSLTVAEGAHTYGRLNQIPAEPGSYAIGLAHDMGNRRTMEDAFAFVVDYAGIQGQGYFAIFDGHAGKQAAEWCGKNFHEYLLRKLLEAPDKPVVESIAGTFEAVDEELTKMSEYTTTNSGCTAVAAFLRLEDEHGRQSFLPSQENGVAAQGKFKTFISNPFSSNKGKTEPDVEVKAEDEKTGAALSVKAPRRVLYMANVGDARAVLGRQGRAVRLTYDHKGNDRKEVTRIREAGGFVLNNRVNGVLAVTRSLGDSAMKEFVVGQPFTSEIELSQEDHDLIIACDGLWDVIDDQAAIDLIRDIPDAQAAAKTLLTYALDNFSNDNVTVLVVKLNPNSKPGKTEADGVKREPKDEPKLEPKTEDTAT